MSERKQKGQRQQQKATDEAEKRLLVTVPNPKMYTVFGKPFRLVDVVEDDEGEEKPEPVHADLAFTIETFLRSRDTNGRNAIVESNSDSERIKSIGEALQAAANGFIRMPKADYKWLLRKAEAKGYVAFPTEAAAFYEALESAEEVEVAEEAGTQQ